MDCMVRLPRRFKVSILSMKVYVFDLIFDRRVVWVYESRASSQTTASTCKKSIKTVLEFNEIVFDLPLHPRYTPNPNFSEIFLLPDLMGIVAGGKSIYF